MGFKVGLAAVVVALPFVVQPVVAQASTAPCARTALSVVAGTVLSWVDAAAPGGRFQVGVNQTSQVAKFVRWDNGVPSVLPLSADEASIAAVNDDGQVVGSSWAGEAWRLRDGVVSTLPTPAGYATSSPVGVNASSQVAGNVQEADGGDRHGVLWGADGQPRVLDTPAGYNDVNITGIDNDGTMVGTVADIDFANATTRTQRAAYWWSDGTVHILPASSVTAFSSASSVRNGLAAGVDDGRAVIWRLGAMAPGDPIATADYVGAINAGGSVILDGPLRIYQPGVGERTLPTSDLASGGYVRGLTDTNQAYGADNHTSKAVRWNCS